MFILGVFPALVAVSVSAPGCGARSNPTDIVSGETGATSRSSCDDPQVLTPLEDVVLRGTLAGPGELSGWCGRDEGAEDVYLLPMRNNRDLFVQVLADESDFIPTIRIEESVCGQGEAWSTEGFTRLCTAERPEDPWHTLVLLEKDYYITIDAPPGASGDYAVQLTWRRPELSECNPHSESPTLEWGSVFQWSNTYISGQGEVDGVCGGPGREDMFPLIVTVPGLLDAQVTGTNGMIPMLSLRTGCAGITERECTSNPGGSPFAAISRYIEEPGTYYLLVTFQ